MTTLKWALIGSFVAAIIAAAGGLYLAGASHQRDKTDLKTATDYIEGTADARDATNNLPSDDDGNVGWLLWFGNASD